MSAARHAETESRQAYATAFGQLLRRLRMAQGLTPKELADRADVNATTVRRYEDGQTLPDLYTLRLLAEALGVSLQAFVAQADLLVDVDQALVERGAAGLPRKRRIKPKTTPLGAWRTATGTTLQEVAEHVGVSTSTVFRWEAGTRWPSEEARRILEQFTGGAVPARVWT